MLELSLSRTCELISLRLRHPRASPLHALAPGPSLRGLAAAWHLDLVAYSRRALRLKLRFLVGIGRGDTYAFVRHRHFDEQFAPTLHRPTPQLLDTERFAAEVILRI